MKLDYSVTKDDLCKPSETDRCAAIVRDFVEAREDIAMVVPGNDDERQNTLDSLRYIIKRDSLPVRAVSKEKVIYLVRAAKDTQSNGEDSDRPIRVRR